MGNAPTFSERRPRRPYVYVLSPCGAGGGSKLRVHWTLDGAVTSLHCRFVLSSLRRFLAFSIIIHGQSTALCPVRRTTCGSHTHRTILPILRHRLLACNDRGRSRQEEKDVVRCQDVFYIPYESCTRLSRQSPLPLTTLLPKQGRLIPCDKRTIKQAKT